MREGYKHARDPANIPFSNSIAGGFFYQLGYVAQNRFQIWKSITGGLVCLFVKIQSLSVSHCRVY